MFVIDKSSIGHYNKSYDYEDNNKYMENSGEKCQKKVSKPFKQLAFFENFF